MAYKIPITAALVSLFIFAGCADAVGDRYVGFAECLTSKEVKMYGAYWCPHCASQKKLFGKQGFEKINYIECDARGEGGNPQLCLAKNIKGYPTWDFADGSRVEGEMRLSELAKKTGCELPKTETK